MRHLANRMPGPRALALAAAVLAGTAGPAGALDCTVETIERLMEKGFTPEQISRMCAGAGAAETAPEAAEAAEPPEAAEGPAGPPAPAAREAAPADAAQAPPDGEGGVTVFGATQEAAEDAGDFTPGPADAYLPGRWKVVSIDTDPGLYGMASGATQGSNRSVEIWEISVDGGRLSIAASPRTNPDRKTDLDIAGGKYGDGAFEVTLRRGTAETVYRLRIDGRQRMTGTALTRDTFMEESGLGHIAGSVGMSSVIEYTERVTATRIED